MNYRNDDYFMGHLLKQARKTKSNKLEVDVLGNIAKPKELLTETIIDSIKSWNQWFSDLVKRSGSSMDYIKSAILTIEFDLEQTRLHNYDKRYIESPFVCEFIIIDDRDREYKSKQDGWWFPET